MKQLIYPAAVACLVLCISCNDQLAKPTTPTTDTAIGKIELYDTSAAKLIDTNAVIRVIGRHYKWSEGPVWIPSKQILLFSAVKENKIYRWDEKDTPTAYLSPSGYTDTAYRDGENGPNDLVADSKNNIYFTDPIYGLPKGATDPTRELNFEGVYKISPYGKLTLLLDSIERPNGIALSPDEKTLYVGSSDDPHTRWYSYQLDSTGNILRGGVLLDGTGLKARATVKQGADGFKVDKYGNIFSAGPDGVNIISPAGKLLGLIKIYHRPASNCAFNEKKDVLYITNDDRVLRVRLR